MTDNNEHRAAKMLREYGQPSRRSWRGMASWVAEAKLAGKTWPEWCLVPNEGWYSIRPPIDPSHSSGLHLRADILYDALGLWRLSKGVYRLSPDFSTELLRTSLKGNIPPSALTRMPEWCVYIELTGLLHSDEFRNVHGAWVYLSHSFKCDYDRLCVILDGEEVVVPHMYDLAHGTVAEMVTACLHSQRQTLDAIMDGLESAGQDVDRVAEVAGYKERLPNAHEEMLSTVLQVMLYICSSEPEVTDREEPDASPSRARPKRIGKRDLFQSADKPRVWTIGEKIGQAIRNHREEPGDRKHTRGHLRRAHWHGYWTGPRNSDAREFTYKWLSPMAVGVR